MSSSPTQPSAGWALITGASSGIGLCYAQQLAAMGYALLIVSNQQQPLEEAAATLHDTYGVPVTALYRDLARPDAARELYDYCCDHSLSIDLLVNNAGIFLFDDVTTTPTQRIELMLNLHVTTPTLLCRYFGAAMQQRGHGYILNMSSMAAWMPFPGIALYAATKSYLRTLTRAMYNELRDTGVSMTAVCPGAVATQLYNLSARYQRLALRLGIMMTPQRLAHKALRALFAGRRCVVPGAINALFIPLTQLIPGWAVRLIKRKAKFYRYGR